MTKTIVIVAVIVIVAIAGYFVFRSDGTPEVTNTPTASATPLPSKTPTPSQSAIKVFTVVGSNFSFSVPQIKVKKGDTVKIIFQSTGGVHDFVLDDFNVKTPNLQSGQSAEVTFVANKTGSFEYYCSIGTHRAMGMKGDLIVQ